MNVKEIAECIQNAIIEYQKNNPNDLTEHNARKYALEVVMKKSRGRLNPVTINAMILLEKSVYSKQTILQC